MASAQASRTYVSGVGDDANPCSRTAPCKTFAGAISKTAANGEINCLDTAGFGTVTITKSMTIKCDKGTVGGVLSSATTGVTINAAATDTIYLIGLDINGTLSGIQGIRFLAGGTLIVDDCDIRNVTQNGILFAPSSSATLHVINSRISTTGVTTDTPYAGIYIRPSGGTAAAKVTVNDTLITNGNYGIIADGTGTTGKITGLIRNSNVSGNLANGITTSIGSASGATLTIDSVGIFGNGNNGLASSGVNAGMLVKNSAITGNQGGVFTTAGSVIVSYGNNSLNGNNGNDGAFTSVIALK